jgi:MraZ protein
MAQLGQKMEEATQQPPKIEPPRGMYPGRLDDRGRLKLPANFQQYFGALGEKRFFVTSLDRRIAQIYTIPAWKENEKFFAGYREDPKTARNVAFNAADLGAEADIDGQGRILFSAELRRELGIENQPVRLFAYRGRIEVLSEKIYEERKREASASPVDDVAKLEAAGLN